jgi:endonuclease III related protein
VSERAFIAELFERMLDRYGPQQWWPAEDEFEVMVGAVLVQRTAWRNAELAIAALRAAQLLDPVTLSETPPERIAGLIRSAGFYRRKAPLLVRIASFVLDGGGVPCLADLDTASLRERLLAIDGIGPETADAILLYAFHRPVFVIDTYALRLFERLQGVTRIASPAELRDRVIASLPRSARLNEFHALIVEHGKRHCRARPECVGCCVRNLCRSALPRQAVAAATLRADTPDDSH